MCEFRCDACQGAGGKPFGTFSYEMWIHHLLTAGHQKAIKKRLNPRGTWRDEDDSFVISIPIRNQPLPWKFVDLVEWLSSFGVVTQFVDYDHLNCCIVTIKGFGKNG